MRWVRREGSRCGASMRREGKCLGVYGGTAVPAAAGGQVRGFHQGWGFSV